MSTEENKNKNSEATTNATGEKGGEKKGEKREIEVTVNTSSMEKLIEQLKEKDDEAKRLGAEVEKQVREKKELAKTLGEKTAVAEDLEGKLKIIAQKKFDEKKAIIMKAAKELIKDEDRLKKIEEGIKEPEDLKATEFMIDTLATAIKEGKEAHEKVLTAEEKKAQEEAAKIEAGKKAGEKTGEKTGEKVLTAEEKKAAEKKAEVVGTGGVGQVSLAQQSGEGGRKEYDTHEAMIRDLRKRQHSEDPEVAAEADAILDELFRKWGRAVKKDYEGRGKAINVGEKSQPSLKDLTKKGGEAKRVAKGKGE